MDEAELEGLKQRAAGTLDSAGESDKIDSGYRRMFENRSIFQYTDLKNGLPKEGAKNTISDKVDSDGRVLQRRVYGDDSRVYIDFDTTDHNAPAEHPTGALKHVFDYGRKNAHGKPLPLTKQDLANNGDIIREGDNYHDEKKN